MVALWQQIFEVASASLDLSVALSRLTAAVGAAFQVDGCLIVLPTTVPPATAPVSPPSASPQIVCWLAGLQTLPLQLLCSPSRSLPAPGSFAPIVIADLESLAGDSAMYGTAGSLIETWQSIPFPISSPIQAQAVLGVAVPTPASSPALLSLMRSRAYQWTEAEIEGLTIVSQQIALVLSHLQLQQQLSKQSHYQAVVNQLTMAIRNSSDINEILKLATDGTANALQVDRGLLLQLKYWDPLFRSRAPDQIPKVRVTVTCEWNQTARYPESVRCSELNADPLSVAAAPPQAFWLSECALCQKALINPAKPIVVQSSQDMSSIDTGIGVAPVFNLQALPAILVAPLESQGTVLGFLVFQRDQAHAWQPEEIELVELVSAQVSTAIIQTETLRQVQALVEKRTAELRQSLTVQSKLYERTRQQIDQLRHLNQLKDEFLSTVSHELRTPLTSMTMAIRMLRQVGITHDRSTRYLDILEQQCAQETSLINDLLALQELESNQLPIHVQEFDLRALVEEMAIAFRQRWAVKGLTLSLTLPKRPLKLRSDRDSLSRILLELLTNAGKYSEPNSQVKLVVTHRPGQPADTVTLSLSNLGSGIASEELPYIFDKFRRAQGATQNAIQGTGLGLALVKCLVQHLNGTITASSCSTPTPRLWETCFTLTLPQFFNSSEA